MFSPSLYKRGEDNECLYSTLRTIGDGWDPDAQAKTTTGQCDILRSSNRPAPVQTTTIAFQSVQVVSRWFVENGDGDGADVKVKLGGTLDSFRIGARWVGSTG